ncbi:MAG: hypothetical protein HFJ37_05930 [Clostridia bacterium]|nr:hypothetical protein [Clostridia bacterium]
MKKYRKMVYLFLILVIAILGIMLYDKVSKANSKDGKEKTFSEVKFLENKLVDLLNQMNHIETRNYNVSVSEISKQAKEQKSQTSSSSQSNSSSDSSSESGGSSGGGNSSGSEASENESNQNNQKFSLKSTGVLTNSNEINWEYIKGEIEILYASLPTITLDLYQLDVSQEDVLGFNKEFDLLTVAIKEENKQKTLNLLSKIYEYIPKFTDKATDEELDKIIAQAKSNLFKAYSKLDAKNWSEISNDIRQTVESYSKLMTNTNISGSKQYSISKAYVMLNELQNAVNVQDEAVFLIKYKNILEEMNNL